MAQRKREDFADVKQSWKCDLLVYTSTITAGVNFDEEHFNSFIHVYVKGTVDAIGFVQGCFRVRKFTS